jgi:TolB protein
VINADGTNLTQLETLGLDPVWSPDGQQIAFTAHHLAIAVMNSDGSQVRLLTGPEALDQRPAWSPDGQQIAFVSDRDGNREIYVINSDGTGERWLMATDAPARWPMDRTRVRFVETSQ